jgi:hypothetical protein
MCGVADCAMVAEFCSLWLFSLRPLLQIWWKPCVFLQFHVCC